jgi:hypothetical protein
MVGMNLRRQVTTKGDRSEGKGAWLTEGVESDGACRFSAANRLFPNTFL